MNSTLDCEHCPVATYCGTMVSSIKLCRSIHSDNQSIKEIVNEED